VWNFVPENVMNSINCFKLTKTLAFFGHFVFLSLDSDVTLRQFTLRNHDIATEIYYVKNQGYSTLSRNGAGVASRQVIISIYGLRPNLGVS